MGSALLDVIPKGGQLDTQERGQEMCVWLCVCVFEREQRVMTHPWAAEGAGGEAR